MKIVMYVMLLWVFVSFTGCVGKDHVKERGKLLSMAINFCKCQNSSLKQFTITELTTLGDMILFTCNDGKVASFIYEDNYGCFEDSK